MIDSRLMSKTEEDTTLQKMIKCQWYTSPHLKSDQSTRHTPHHVLVASNIDSFIPANGQKHDSRDQMHIKLIDDCIYHYGYCVYSHTIS